MKQRELGNMLIIKKISASKIQMLNTLTLW